MQGVRLASSDNCSVYNLTCRADEGITLVWVLVLHVELGIRMCMMCLTQSTWKLVVAVRTEIMAKCGLDEVDDFEDVSRVNCFVAGAPFFSFHCRTVDFHHLNVFCNSRCILWPGVVISPLSLSSYRELKRTKRGTCWRVRKLYVNSYTSVINPLRTDIHTYKHNLRLR